MPSRFNPRNTLVLLPCILYCASCAPQQKPCVRCALSCDDADAHELKKHPSVRVDVTRLSHTLHEETCSVSSLYTGGGGGRCSVVVPDCSQWDSPIALRIYANDSKSVSEPLYSSMDVKPVSTGCDPDAVSHRDNLNVSNRNLLNTLLVLLAALLHLLPP
ncbi:hypothetical protein R3I93_016666 [Phoxinus phoxinus]|uniref:Uncharacterized protein n=1 Tax=Phoxinus phoxinus TaxID=58324 RepID=A0AAN9CLX6_9TELE